MAAVAKTTPAGTSLAAWSKRSPCTPEQKEPKPGGLAMKFDGAGNALSHVGYSNLTQIDIQPRFPSRALAFFLRTHHRGLNFHDRAIPEFIAQAAGTASHFLFHINRYLREAEDGKSAAADDSHRFRRMPKSQMEVRNALGDQRPHTHHGKTSDDEVIADRRPAPMVAPSRTRVGSVCSSGAEERSRFRSLVVARGNRSFVKIVPALIITPSSIVTAAQM